MGAASPSRQEAVPTHHPVSLPLPSACSGTAAGVNHFSILKARRTLPSFMRLLAVTLLHLCFSLAMLNPAAFPAVPNDLLSRARGCSHHRGAELTSDALGLSQAFSPLPSCPCTQNHELFCCPVPSLPACESGTFGRDGTAGSSEVHRTCWPSAALWGRADPSFLAPAGTSPLYYCHIAHMPSAKAGFVLELSDTTPATQHSTSRDSKTPLLFIRGEYVFLSLFKKKKGLF